MLRFTTTICKQQETKMIFNVIRNVSSKPPDFQENTTTVNNISYPRDNMTNATPKLLSHLGRNLHLQKQHPLNLIKQKIANYMYQRYKQNLGVPITLIHIHNYR